MKTSLKERIIALNLSYVKEMVTLILINISLIIGATLLYFYIGELLIILIGIVVLAGSNYFYLSRYSTLEKSQEEKHINELISLLSYFEIFLTNNNNVYNSFKLLIPYSSDFMKNSIETMLNQIDMDKSVSPFIKFAHKFPNRIIESLMLSIYQMIENGANSQYFLEFNILFEGISHEYQTNLLENHKKGIEKLSSWPLFGAGGIIIVLTFSIMSIMGDMINVL